MGKTRKAVGVSKFKGGRSVGCTDGGGLGSNDDIAAIYHIPRDFYRIRGGISYVQNGAATCEENFVI